ncbi:hypothetical protein PIB30_055037 [Stylosanthes scabra]|uniref:Uncharacterized protein n=1 Tax=Stylosanthes scabra TaxID=79078 RepID=A0ABU6UIF5_9FABA|nr:hypothetical protein [Stylosanthes scabra]
MPPQTSTQPQPTTQATYSDSGPPPIAYFGRGHKWLVLFWDDVRKGTKEITNIFMEHYNWYVPYSAKHQMRQSNSGGRSGLGDHGGQAPSVDDAQHILEKGAPYHLIPDDIFKRYVDFWASPGYQAMQRANKSNHASNTGGSLHTGGPGGGSITYPATAKKMAAEIGRVPSQSEVFMRIHTRKKDRGQFVDECSEQQIELHKAEMKRFEDERAARIDASESAGPPIDEDEVWDKIDGGRKRGRVYGKGKVPKRPAPRLVDPEDASTCSGLDVREHITLMNKEIQQQAKAYKREMEAWKRRQETDVSRPRPLLTRSQ